MNITHCYGVLYNVIFRVWNKTKQKRFLDKGAGHSLYALQLLEQDYHIIVI